MLSEKPQNIDLFFTRHKYLILECACYYKIKTIGKISLMFSFLSFSNTVTRFLVGLTVFSWNCRALLIQS